MASFVRVFVLLICGKIMLLSQAAADDQLDELRADFDAKLQQCTSQIERLTDEVKERFLDQERLLEAKVKQRCEPLAEQSRKQRQSVIYNTPKTIAFFALLTYDLYGVRDNQTIVFDLVETNIGSGYDVSTGVFTVPTSGVYVITWTTTNYNNFSYLQSELMVNGQIKIRRWSDSGTSNDVSSATGTAVLSLTGGDAVWIRANTAHLGDALKGGLMSSFSGWLLK